MQGHSQATESGWQEALDARLVRRLMQPLHPGVIGTHVSRTVPARARLVAQRLPLLTELAQRWGASEGFLPAGRPPMVYGLPIGPAPAESDEPGSPPAPGPPAAERPVVQVKAAGPSNTGGREATLQRTPDGDSKGVQEAYDAPSQDTEAHEGPMQADGEQDAGDGAVDARLAAPRPVVQAKAFSAPDGGLGRGGLAHPERPPPPLEMGVPPPRPSVVQRKPAELDAGGDRSVAEITQPSAFALPAALPAQAGRESLSGAGGELPVARSKAPTGDSFKTPSDAAAVAPVPDEGVRASLQQSSVGASETTLPTPSRVAAPRRPVVRGTSTTVTSSAGQSVAREAALIRRLPVVAPVTRVMRSEPDGPRRPIAWPNVGQLASVSQAVPVTAELAQGSEAPVAANGDPFVRAREAEAAIPPVFGRAPTESLRPLMEGVGPTVSRLPLASVQRTVPPGGPPFSAGRPPGNGATANGSVPSRLLKKTEGWSPQGRQRSRLQETVREVAPVRGRRDPQVTMLGFIDLESRVPPEHPLRTIKALADQALAALSPEFDRMYAEAGRPSIPPERLLKASVLIALYSVRSERAFCEELDYHLLFRWFLDMNLIEPSFDPTTFTKNRKRLLEHHVGQALFDEVVMAADRHGLLSDEHFTVDGTLIEAAASLKSFRPRDGDPPSTTDGDSGNPSVDFRGERRSNTTHQSTTDPEARLLRKGKGKEAKLVFMAHALMENRPGMLTDFQVSSATGTAERDAVPVLLEQARERGFHPRTLGGDKNYDTRECVAAMRERRVTPHVAQNTSGRRSAIDGRTARHRGYAVSQRIRKRVEEIFGWMKTVGGFRRTRYRGLDRTGLAGYLVATAYNLVRMAKLVPSGAEGLLSRQQEAIVTQAP